MAAAERAALARVLDAVAAATTDGGSPSPELAVAVGREALRRVPDHELLATDVPSLARLVVAGTELLARRGDGVAVAVLPPAEGRPRDGSVVQLAADDRPFLLSTVLDEIERRGHRVVSQLHPIVGTTRDADGKLIDAGPPRGAPAREALLHLVLERVLDRDEVEDLTDRLREVAADVRAATDDFEAMDDRLRQHAAVLRAGRRGVDPDEAAEVADLIAWLLDENVVLLGTHDLDVLDADGVPVAGGGREPVAVRVVPGSGLGLLGDESRSRYRDPVPIDRLEHRLAEDVRDPALLAWSRTRRRSTVQRQVRMEHLAFARFADDGSPAGILRVLALFTRRGEDAPADATPVLRRKLADVLDIEDVVAGSHDEVVLTSLFQALPKDELFQIEVDDLRQVLLALLHAEDHREIRALTRTDAATRTVSVLVAVPRDTYSPQLRERFGRHLRARYDADRVDVSVSVGDRNEALARYLLTLERDVPDIDQRELEREVRDLARSWLDEVSDQLTGRIGVDEAAGLVHGIARRLPRSYRDSVAPDRAVEDLLLIGRVVDGDDELATDWQPDREADTDREVAQDELPERWRLRVVVRGAALELSAFLPVLESLGLTVVEEVPHQLLGDPELHLHDFGVRVPEEAVEPLTTEAGRQRVADAVLAAWRGHAQTDPLTRLVLLTDLTWRDLGILRAYRRYRRQLGTPYTPQYVEENLIEHAEATAALLDRFRARFDPALGGGPADRAEAEYRAAERFEEAMTEVTRLDADRILRGLAALVDATLRTNAFRGDAIEDAGGAPYISLKFDPSRIPDVPRPVPHREVFVHSPLVEGIHLRGGPVARGGLRWSDRRDDVRTEVLDLVKAQVLKNALIVPTGAKGGFVLTRPPREPQALREEVEQRYITFVRGLLDVTDDLEDDGDGVVPPPGVVRHDGDDTYLVVAADRGTATFSDTANAVAQRYRFWLGDAFASGGSRGYDHKALGVTAKGAWRAVARHFRELGVDVQAESVTIVGIGDLSGDVFSNGMQRSECIELVAAFDHRHVFLDPNPDPAVSFAERARVAALPRSSWGDYDPSLLSPGGMIVARDARTVELSDQIRERLRIDAAELSPPELIRAILSAPVDLLWAGGIGTYIRASDERNDDVGDRANDEVRVVASQVRARVIGEGANLALTQRARIELSKRGSRVDQDAIHNAAGVATSDAEVNLKILLDLAIRDGRLAAKDRDAVLADLASDVVAQVLDAVDLQVAAISAEVARGADDVVALDEFMARLEATGELDREVAVLPSTEQLQARGEAGGGLTRPELATLFAWAKRELKEALLASDAPEDPVLADAVSEPFPARAVERFGDLLPRHRLRRELIATAVANNIVDRFGVTFASGLATETGVGLPLVARAVRIATRTVDAPRWWAAIESMSAVHDPARIRELNDVVNRLVIDLTTTLLHDPLLTRDPVGLLERDTAVATELLERGLRLGSVTQQRARLAHARWLVDDLVEPELARFLAVAADLSIVSDVAVLLGGQVSERSAVTVADVAFHLAEALGIDRVAGQLARVPLGEGWSRRQHRGVDLDLRRLRRDAAAVALRTAGDPSLEPKDVVERFVEDRADALARARETVQQLERDAAALDAVAVAARAIRDAVER